jgi:hypothetical protein
MKKPVRLILCLLIICLAFAGTVVADLVLHLSFDEGNGDITKDRVKGVTGSLVNNPTWVDGKFNKALEFDGKGAKVEIKKGDDPEPANEISIAMWAKLSVNNGNYEFVRKQTPNGKGYDIRLEGASLKWWVNTGGWLNASDAQPLPVDEWFFITGTYDGSILKLYINGDEVATSNVSGKIQYDDSDLLIGSAAPHDPNFNLNGALDEFMMWNNAIAPDEMKNVMKTPVAVEPNSKLSVAWGSIKDLQ